MKTKTLEDLMQKMTKFVDWINRGENSEKGFEKLTVRISIGRKLDSIDQKIVLINPASIEHRLSQANSNLNFYRIFDWSSNSFDQSKIWKTQFFEKQSNLMLELLKA